MIPPCSKGLEAIFRALCEPRGLPCVPFNYDEYNLKVAKNASGKLTQLEMSTMYAMGLSLDWNKETCPEEFNIRMYGKKIMDIAEKLKFIKNTGNNEEVSFFNLFFILFISKLTLQIISLILQTLQELLGHCDWLEFARLNVATADLFLHLVPKGSDLEKKIFETNT